MLQSMGSQRVGHNWETKLHWMKLMVTSFKRSHAGTALLSVSDSVVGHCQPKPSLETPGHSGQVWVSLLWRHCSLLLRPGVHRILVLPSKGLFPQSCVSSGCSMVGLMMTSSKRAYAICRSAAPRSPALVAGHCWPVPPQDTRKHSKSGLAQI